jgi:hypothetical protein
MVDNTSQTGADTIATDDIGGVKYQRVKVGQGDDGVYADTSFANPLHVNLAGSGGNTAAVTQALTAAGLSTLAGTGSTTGSAVLNVAAAGNASFHLLATAFVGTVVFEQSFDPAGTAGTWASVPVIAEDGPNTPISVLPISTAAAYIRQFSAPMLGPALFRVRCSAFTSGSLTAYLKGGPGWYENAVVQSRGGVPTQASVTSVASSTTILAANQNRLMARVINDSTSVLYLNETGATASTTAYTVKLAAGQTYETPHPTHTSAITGIWSAANGAARVTEW